MKRGVGAIQLEKASPPPCAGTLPAAIAPTTVPMKNGVITEERAKVAPAARCSFSPSIDLREANPEPRRTIPSTARISGTYKVLKMALKTDGKAVQRTTRMKTSQTWLASQTGVSERWIAIRGSQPFFALPAIRSQKPPPKSAPPKIA